MSTNELEEKLKSLPTLTERLQTWNKLIKELHESEVSGLEMAISGKVEIESLIEKRDHYEQLFKMLVSRLSIPILFCQEKINEEKNASFLSDLKQFRINSHKELEEKAINLANGYFEAYRPNLGKSDRQYVLECKSMVTGFLFTTPFFKCDGAVQRELYVKEFKGWDPNYYCILFYKELDKLFKKQDK